MCHSRRLRGDDPPPGDLRSDRVTRSGDRATTRWKGRVAALYEKWRQVGEDHSELLLTPRKVDVQVTTFGLAWAPFASGVTAYK